MVNFFTLGFQKEADSLLSVTKLSTISDSKNTRKAREILLKLAEETNIFPTGWELSERYLFVVVSGCIFSSALLLLEMCVFVLLHILIVPTPPVPPQYEVANDAGSLCAGFCSLQHQNHLMGFKNSDFGGWPHG